MDNVVKTFFLLTTLDDYGSVRKAETEFYERHAPQLVTTPPAATLMVVPSLARPELLVQYEVIAALDRDMPDWEVTYYPEYWAGRELSYPHVPKEHAKFARSQSIGNLLVVSGCQALDHETVRVETGDFAGQSRIVLDKVRVALEEAGGSLDNLVKTNVFIKDANALATYREVEQAFFREHAPERCRRSAGKHGVRDERAAEAGVPGRGRSVRRRERRRARLAGASSDRNRGRSRKRQRRKARVPVRLRRRRRRRLSPTPIEREVSTALDNLRDALARAGSAMSRIVKITLLLRDADDYPNMQSALLSYYREHAPHLVDTPPATTFMQVPAIVPSGARFQVDAVAVT